MLETRVESNFKDSFRSAAWRADVFCRDFLRGEKMSSRNLGFLSVEDDAFHRAYLAVHYAVRNDAEFFHFHFRALDEFRPNGFSALDNSLVVPENAARHNDVPMLAFYDAFSDSAADFYVSRGFQFVTVVHVAFYDDASQEVNVASLDSN